VPGTIGGGCQVEAGLVASLEEAKWNRRPKPHILSDGLESEPPRAGLILNDQVKALRRGGPHLHYQIVKADQSDGKSGPSPGGRTSAGMRPLEGDPSGLRVGDRPQREQR